MARPWPVADRRPVARILRERNAASSCRGRAGRRRRQRQRGARRADVSSTSSSSRSTPAAPFGHGARHPVGRRVPPLPRVWPAGNVDGRGPRGVRREPEARTPILFEPTGSTWSRWSRDAFCSSCPRPRSASGLPGPVPRVRGRPQRGRLRTCADDHRPRGRRSTSSRRRTESE